MPSAARTARATGRGVLAAGYDMRTTTLAVILHYNTVECTDALYRQLKPFESDDYELIVLDNGSAAGAVCATHDC